MTLPAFRYHPDPIRSGSVVASEATCKACRQARGYIYSGPVYAEDELDDALCPWCVADGTAHANFDATFVDDNALPDALPASVVEEITQRTPGYRAWQTERWPGCCGDAMAFLEPAGIAEIRARYRELEGEALAFIVYELQVSGGAATKMLQSLHRDTGPTAYVFQCLVCESQQVVVDGVFSIER